MKRYQKVTVAILAVAILGTIVLFSLIGGDDKTEGASKSNPTVPSTTTTLPEQGIIIEGVCYETFINAVEIFAENSKRGIEINGDMLMDAGATKRASELIDYMVNWCPNEQQLQGVLAQVITSAKKIMDDSPMENFSAGYIDFFLTCEAAQSRIETFPDSLIPFCLEAENSAAFFIQQSQVGRYETGENSKLPPLDIIAPLAP